MKEIWKDVENYEGFYQVSNLGRVRSVDRYVNGNHITCDFQFVKGKMLKLRNNKFGYPVVMLRKNRAFKTVLVHRLVAKAFIPNPNNLPYINHKDENPANTVATNLEWCTPIYNLKYSDVFEKIRPSKIRKVIQFDMEMNEIKRWDSLKAAAASIGRAQQNISRCCRGKCYSCGGFKWKYEDEY